MNFCFIIRNEEKILVRQNVIEVREALERAHDPRTLGWPDTYDLHADKAICHVDVSVRRRDCTCPSRSFDMSDDRRRKRLTHVDDGQTARCTTLRRLGRHERVAVDDHQIDAPDARGVDACEVGPVEEVTIFDA
jgi:hypothetical protein